MSVDHALLLQRLRDGTLDPAEFDHAAHVGVAYEALSRYEFFAALAMLADGLRDLARRAGVEDKFNATVTFAFTSLIAERMQQSPAADAERFLQDNPDLLERGVLAPWYSSQRLQQGMARRLAVLPDRGDVASAVHG